MEEITTTIRLPLDLYEHIKEQAKKYDRSFAAQLRMIVRDDKMSREASVPANA